jgi:glutamine amidotransferase
LTVLLDYGMGNLRSVQKAVEHLGFNCEIRSDVSGASKIIVPGVGAFGAAMQRIAPIADDIREHARTGTPILGLCLGQQLLFERSEEHGDNAGLGILKGEVKYLRPGPGNKVPNVGWCAVQAKKGSRLFDGVAPESQFYFVHSLYTSCADAGDVAAIACHTEPFAAAVEHGNVWATQFHPEKSGEAGLHVLGNFMRC